ncbi:unnamed protein product [Peronospora belbahrii]|uniref:Uncharacterized protein n=1 Tax=Peronospora belbahrii TaxID=622444 RepID=A0AAU9L1Z9_9STRA|nr:unnamed protein product [Peronospora belbahrii]
MDIDEISAGGLSKTQQEWLQKLLPILGLKGVEYLIPRAKERLTSMPSSSPSPMATMAQEVVRRPKPIQMEVDKFDGKEGDSLMLWFRQVESAMFIADITYEPYRVGFATGKLGG